MAEGSDWAFSWFKQSPNQTLEKQTLRILSGLLFSMQTYQFSIYFFSGPQELFDVQLTVHVSKSTNGTDF